MAHRRYRPSTKANISLWLYSLLLTLAFPFVLLALLRKERKAGTASHRIWERLGRSPKPKTAGGYLFHCVSVGEVVAASAVIKKLMLQNPAIPVTVTTTTATGSARVKAIFGDTVHHCYLPYDLKITMLPMFNRIKPDLVVITEVELWPNMLDICWRRGVPSLVINARMSARSAARYNKIGGLFLPMLEKLSHVCAQGEQDFASYKMLGMPENKLTLTNNMKFDQDMPDVSATRFLTLRPPSRMILVGGSTHEPEETALLNTYRALKPEYPDLLLVIVPRHPQRFAAVANLLVSNAVSFIQTSCDTQVLEDTDVVLVDEMGKLNEIYGIADVAFVGGSLANKGGHNALEPAAFKLPILMGPHTYNNPIICKHLQEAGALKIVETEDELKHYCAYWLANVSARKESGEAGFRILNANRGAVALTLKVVQKLLTEK